MKPEIIQFVRCPVTGTPVSGATSDLIGRVNQAIVAGLIVNRKGTEILQPIQNGLVNEDFSILMPCLRGICCLSADDVIELGQVKEQEKIMPEKSIFKKIIDGEIPADILYENDDCLAFRDIDAKAPTHVLVIPKKEILNVAALKDEDAALAGRLLLAVRDVARQLGLEGGYRVVANCGQDGGQSVDHLHFHILGGRQLTWPPG